MNSKKLLLSLFLFYCPPVFANGINFVSASNGYYNCGVSGWPELTSYTVTAWINIPSPVLDKRYVIASKGTSNTRYLMIFSFINSADQYLQLELYSASAPSANYYADNFGVPRNLGNGQDHFVAGRKLWNGTTYVYDVWIDTGIATVRQGNGTSSFTTTGHFQIGYYSAVSVWGKFNGKMWDVTVYNRGLSNTELEKLYWGKRYYENTSGLVGYYPMVDGPPHASAVGAI